MKLELNEIFAVIDKVKDANLASSPMKMKISA